MAALPSTESNQARLRLDFTWIRRFPGYASLFLSLFVLNIPLWFVLPHVMGRPWHEVRTLAENPGIEGVGRGVWRILVSSVVHPNGIQWWFSIVALPIVGQDAEECFGTKRLLLIFFAATLCGCLVTLALEPTQIIESSAGVIALFGALLSLLFRHPRAIAAELRRVLIRGVITLVGLSLFVGLLLPLAVTAAHASGLVCGLALGWWLKPTTKYEPVVGV